MKASFFDIDGTLVKCLIIHKFPEQLARRKVIDEKFFREIDNWVNLYLKGKTTYRKIAIEIPKIYSRCT